jgi:ADP-heptose:LPS heptosyltransferase
MLNKPVNPWFHQRESYGLGNFVMATPALETIAGDIGTITVYFETTSIADLYKKCHFIKPVTKRPLGTKIGATKGLKRLKNESETQAYYRTMTGKSANLPPTYVDRSIKDPLKDHVAVFHGCLGDTYLNKKNLGKVIRQLILDEIRKRGKHPVILGNQRDKEKFWHENNLIGCKDHLGKLSLKGSVDMLSRCEYFISNDTGLYHVAGALNKPGMVIWHRTDLTKNKSTCAKIKHVVEKDLNIKVIKDELTKFLDTMI